MVLVALLTLLLSPRGSSLVVGAQTHSLTYIYTALSKPVKLPGIHQFTAMGLLDNDMIDYYDSDYRMKVPKQKWMEDQLPKNYWVKGTQSRQSKEQWFQVNLGILKERMRQNDTDIHVLQWLHGCEGDMQPDGKLKFRHGKDMYSYDGNNFLSFDDKNKDWVASSPAAQTTKRKWDAVTNLKEHTKKYLETECMDWLAKFMHYRQAVQAKPSVHLFSKKSRIEGNIILSCMATGFYPNPIILQIKRNDRILTRDDGVITTGIRPNEDSTYQRKDSVEILRSDPSQYTCEVIHQASKLNIETKWDLTVGGEQMLSLIAVIVGILVVLVVAAVVLIVLFKRGMLGSNGGTRTNQGDTSTIYSLPQTSPPPDNGYQEAQSLMGPEKGSTESVDSGSDSGISTASRSEEKKKIVNMV